MSEETSMKVGDKVQPKADVERTYSRAKGREIYYYGAKLVVYGLNSTEGVMSRRMFDRDFEVVPDFFEEGKTYERHSPTQRFEVEAVRGIPGSGLTAFGRLKMDLLNYDGWVTRDWYDYHNAGWKEA